MDGLELLDEFRSESAEGLEIAEQSLMALEAGDETGVHEAFRALHTIKGGSGFLDLQSVNKLAHQMENLLDKVRQGEIAINQEITDLLLQGVDRVRTMIDSDDCGENCNNSDLLDHLTQWLEGGAQPAAATTTSVAQEQTVTETVVLTATPTPPPIASQEPPAGSVSGPRAAAVVSPPSIDASNTRHFGSYLVERGVITCDQLLEALYKQNALATPALVLLNDEIGISPAACIELAREARERGVEVIAWAADQGRIDHSQAAGLAHIQQQSRPPLGQVLSSMGLVDRGQIVHYLGDFHDQKQHLTTKKVAP